MDEKSKSPISLVADLLATMTERALEAERKRDEAKEEAENWYRHYMNKDTQLKEAEAKLAAEIEAHRDTRQALQQSLGTSEVWR